MRQLAMSVLALVLLVGVLAAPAAAQEVRGHMYLSLSATGYDCAGTAIAFTPFNLYMMIHVPDMSGNEIFGWEATINMPASASTLSSTFFPATAQRFGTGNNYLVGTGQAVGDVPFLAAEFSIISLSDPGDNYHFSLDPAVPPTGNTGGPVWLHVDEAIRIPARSDGLLVLPGWRRGFVTLNQNDLTVPFEQDCNRVIGTPAEEHSWGSIKAGYQN